MQGGVKFISAWQRFLVRSLSSVVALAVAPAFDLHRVSPFVLATLYTIMACMSIGNIHEIEEYILCKLYS